METTTRKPKRRAVKKVSKPKKQEPVVPVQEKVGLLRQELSSLLLNRDLEIFGVLCALLARKNVLLLGPPGTAKSLLASLTCNAVDGASYFSWLLTRFSVPEEVLGSFSMKGLKQDKFERVTTGKLPEAHIAFLDEVFKGNSSILNALLSISNERVFYNGSTPQQTPVETIVGASNELPESKELAAFYDRFLLRYWTSYLADREDRKALHRLSWKMKQNKRKGLGALQNTLTLDELHDAQEEVMDVEIPETILDLIVDVQCACEDAGFVASDRRWVECDDLLRASAYIDGRDVVIEDDLLLYADTMWNEPKDRADLYRVVAKTANPMLVRIEEILDACRETYSSIPFNQEHVPEDETAGLFQRVVDANAQFKKALEKVERFNGASNSRNSDVLQDARTELVDMQETARAFGNRISGLN